MCNAPSAPMRAVEPAIFRGTETLEVVGESQYQEALWQIVGGWRREAVRQVCEAVLLPELDNPYDQNAIRVQSTDTSWGISRARTPPSTSPVCTG
jgi:hypothetical protein